MTRLHLREDSILDSPLPHYVTRKKLILYNYKREKERDSIYELSTSIAFIVANES